MKLHLDLETRAPVDVTATGVYVYFDHAETEITHVGYQIDDGPVTVWLPPTSTFDTTGIATTVTTESGHTVRVVGGAMPPELRAALENPDCIIVAHNAGFERMGLASAAGRRIGFPVIHGLARWNCTAARAAACGLPRSLDGAAAALGLAVRKDKAGHKLMKQMCKPRKPTKRDPSRWHDSPEKRLRLAAYNADDVLTEHAVDKVLPNLPAAERDAWELTEAMNDAGIKVDTELLLRVAFMVEDAEADTNRRLFQVTGGQVEAISDHAALTRWLVAHDIDDEGGRPISSVAKQAVAALLERRDLDPVVRSALLLRRDGGGVANRKYRSVLSRLSPDGRVRGALVYAGAAATGRWSSRGVQLQNLPRGGSVDNIEYAIRDILDGASLDEIEFLHGPPLIVAAECLRPILVADPDAWLARGDYSQIEARVLAWLAGAEWKLQAFRDYDAGTGPDTYKIAAASIFGKPVAEISKPERQIGKVGELALGFGGGAGAFIAMGKAYGVKPTRERADEIKVGWRAGNPEVVRFWRDCEDAAIACMESSPGRDFPVGEAGRISYRRNRQLLSVRLPSGRRMAYWTPRLEDRPTPWGTMRPTLIYRGEDSVTHQWAEFDAYGGLLSQGPTQASARDIMRDALRRFPSGGLRPVLTVHDEGIGEGKRARFPRPEDAAEAVRGIMRQIPDYLPGLPVAVDCSAGTRYVKA